MKKILFLFVALATLSCSKDDAPAATVDPIIGTWVETNHKTENLSAGIVEDNDGSICAPLERWTYGADMKGSYKSFYSANNGCVAGETYLFNYSKLSAGTYNMLADGENFPFTVTFSSNNNVMVQVTTENYYRMTTTFARK